MDVFRSRAIPALAALLLAGAAHADCSAIQGTFADESVEKVDGAPRTLSAFAAFKDRPKLFRQERTGPSPTFGGSGPVMSRPKITRLAETVAVKYGPELNLRFLDAGGNVLLQTNTTTPRRWRCVEGRLERKFQGAVGLGETVRTEETQQVLQAAPGGDLVLVETVVVTDGPKAPPKRPEVHFKRVAKSQGPG